jgi:hypothetical protein
MAKAMKTPSLFLLAAAVAAPALAAPPPERVEVGIPFANRAIDNFEAPSDEVLYLEDRNKRWYRAEVGHCTGLKWAHAIGYDTRGSLSLDNGGAILVDGQRCPILSLTRSDGPPKRVKKGKARRSS